MELYFVSEISGLGEIGWLRAFIDDSGSGGDSPWYVLAGYVGTVEAWNTFDKPWREMLDGPPKLDYFKASEAESLRPDGQWAGVSPCERNARIDRCISIVGKHALRAIYVRLKQKDYDEVIKPYVPPMWRNAYYFLFIGFLSAAASSERWHGANRDIEFYFDKTDPDKMKFSKKLYGQVAQLSQFDNVVGNIHYEDEKLFLPLQAADLIA